MKVNETHLLLWDLLSFMQCIFSLSHYMILNGLNCILLEYKENAVGQFVRF